jgi:HEAT repeat protein
VLGAIGEAVTGSVVNDYEFLQRALTHTEPAVRTHAVEAFSRVPTPLAVEAIAFAVTDDAPEVQLAALRALGVLFRSGDGVARARLLNLGRECTNVNLVMAALQALGSACDAELLPDFGELVMHPDSWRALAAVNALKGYKAELRLPLLRRALLHDDAEVVKAAIELLPMSEPVLADLQHCLRHTAWSVRRAAADQMAHVRLPGAAEVLNFRLTLEREPQVIEAIHRSLSQLNRPSIATWSRRPGERGSGE